MRWSTATWPTRWPCCGGDRGGNGLSGYWPYAEVERPAALPDAQVAAYTALMAASQPFIAEEVLAAYDFSRAPLPARPRRRRRQLPARRRGPAPASPPEAVRPAGGGRARPCRLRRGRPRRPRRGLRRRLHRRAAARRRRHRLPGPHRPRPRRLKALAILRSARGALAPGGTLLVAEPMSGTPGAEPITEAYFGFYLLAMGTGRPRTAEELGRAAAPGRLRRPRN